jgi:hypothetical protein
MGGVVKKIIVHGKQPLFSTLFSSIPLLFSPFPLSAA